MTWTPYAVGVAALLAVCVVGPAVSRVLKRRLIAYLDRLERDLEIDALTRRRPYSWGSDLDLFARLTLDEIRGLPETTEPAR